MLLPRAHAQRNKVVGSVVVFVVVVSTKIARSRILGEFASANCSKVSEIGKNPRTCVKAVQKGPRKL